jgi:hypothetical protein
MNIKLNTLFEEYNIWEKDRYEISQIYFLLSEDKKRDLIQNFSILIARVEKIRQDIIIEQEILVWDSISRIKQAIEKAKQEWSLN